MRQLGVGEAVLVQAVALKVLIAEEAVGQVVVGVVGFVEGPQGRWGCVLLSPRVALLVELVVEGDVALVLA